MIEAVNSLLSNTSLLRGSTEAVDSSRSFASNPERLQQVARGPQAPFVSPFIAVDLNHNKAVLQIRDSETGDVLRQFPSESRLQAQEQQQVLSEGGQIFEDAGSSDVVGVQNDAAGVSAQAQVASAALATGAQTGVESLSAGVSVDA